ncbi:MAG TPA: hypothetical protein VHA56_11805 [Mucilaginibacter sp.]|nr:hypothetical protein [Mucilaginibacter sp.]
MENSGVTLVIFTCEGRELLLKNTLDSFFKACDYPFKQIILAVDGIINEAIFSAVKPDIVLYNYKRKGYVNSILNAMFHIKMPYFFWLEDDWQFSRPVDMLHLHTLMKTNDNWAEIALSKYGPLEESFRKHPLGNNLYETTFGFSANPCLCNTKHLQSAFNLLRHSPKGGKPGEDGFENFLSRTFKQQDIKCVIADPVDHLPISHEGYLESTPRNWHMTNSLEEKTKAHLLTIPAPSPLRRLMMVVKLMGTFSSLAIRQLANNKVYEFCFRIISSVKTMTRNE